jgi:uncharacterized protein YdiU (UPF0061 family)
VLREYVLSESMAALGIRTTRALAAITTGEEVYRDTVLPGALLVRVASSHIRVGTFQFFAVREDIEALKQLTDHVIARHYPDAAQQEDPVLALLHAVIAAQADLVASWLLIGFIHGVMNTDNCSVAGETIDYGPCAFMDEYDPATVFSSIDRMGRYAYGNQPSMAQWNLIRLAEALLPLLADDQEVAVEKAQDALAAFGARFEETYYAGLRRKLGLFDAEEGDVELAGRALALMQQDKVDFTRFFRLLGKAAGGDKEPVRGLFRNSAAFDEWYLGWQQRLARERQAPSERRVLMDGVNPAYIPRNHLIEAMIQAAIHDRDFTRFEELLVVLARPYEEGPEFDAFSKPPLENERVTATFCGT